MHRTEKQKNRRGSWLRRTIAVVAMVSILAVLLSQTVFAQNNYIITDGDNVTVHKSFSTDPDVVLDEAGIELSEEDTYTTSYNDGVSNIDIQRMQMVTVTYHGDRSVIGTYGETINSLLARMGIELGKNDVLSCKRDTLTYDGMAVEIIDRVVEITEHDEVVPFETRYFEDPELEPDAELVLVEGADGKVHYKTQIIFENGKEVSREVIEETVLAKPTTKLVICGVDRAINEQPDEPDHRVQESTASSSGNTTNEDGEQLLAGGAGTVGNGVITTSTGSSYTYTDVLTVSATAYSCEGRTGYTYSGTVARVGAIAVDPKVIPLGTKMYIVSNDGQYVYGYCVAEDIGGGIKGHRVDLYFDTFDECWEFGVRTCTVYILG